MKKQKLITLNILLLPLLIALVVTFATYKVQSVPKVEFDRHTQSITITTYNSYINWLRGRKYNTVISLQIKQGQPKATDDSTKPHIQRPN